MVAAGEGRFDLVSALPMALMNVASVSAVKEMGPAVPARGPPPELNVHGRYTFAAATGECLRPLRGPSEPADEDVA